MQMRSGFILPADLWQRPFSGESQLLLLSQVAMGELRRNSRPMIYGAIFISGLVACVVAMTMIIHNAPASDRDDLSNFAMIAHRNQN
ncbi:hypothetical protein [Rhizobium sp. IMFF44]|uniref:hypothetical protein n=1 Tax=Rhizobium sp. IMFF44 TaxID=3342350 RepID=UPI0013AF826E